MQAAKVELVTAGIDTGKQERDLNRRSINTSLLLLAVLAQRAPPRASALTVQDVTPEVAPSPELSPV